MHGGFATNEVLACQILLNLGQKKCQNCDILTFNNFAVYPILPEASGIPEQAAHFLLQFVA